MQAVTKGVATVSLLQYHSHRRTDTHLQVMQRPGAGRHRYCAVIKELAAPGTRASGPPLNQPPPGGAA